MPLISHLQILTIFLLIVPSSSSAQVLPNPKSRETSSSQSRHHHCHHIPRSCNTMCYYNLPRIPHGPPLSPPLPPIDEIDPRYGVEKRLVPSGPNPLHN
ncbi:CLE10p like [Actinidia chinensis var. chinensis]|uniref:CLE10p like n=1 Tax=Actinidia chinensis var. chinensis TaxID=1590841 RepID=A0A2R6RFM9_ACTCC|nr:CLE10p like [Actinidia chinensis var. chinensis]